MQYEDIHPYQLGELIGRGSYADVYLGKNIETNKLFAIKKIKKQIMRPDYMEKIYIEIQILFSLRHDHIMKLEDIKDTANYQYLILEICELGDLEQILTKHFKDGMPEDLAQLYGQQLSYALLEMRSQNISHRDLKLQNLLIDRNLDLKLADFGFAKLQAQNNVLLQSFAGTPLNMAPEILKNEDYNEKCDLWSLGVSLYQLIYAKYPFYPKIENRPELLQTILNSKIDFSSKKISPALQDLIARLLTVDKEKRMGFDEFFSHSWIEERINIENIKKKYQNLLQVPQNQFDQKFADSFGKYLFQFVQKHNLDLGNALGQLLQVLEPFNKFPQIYQIQSVVMQLVQKLFSSYEIKINSNGKIVTFDSNEIKTYLKNLIMIYQLNGMQQNQLNPNAFGEFIFQQLLDFCENFLENKYNNQIGIGQKQQIQALVIKICDILDIRDQIFIIQQLDVTGSVSKKIADIVSIQNVYDENFQKSLNSSYQRQQQQSYIENSAMEIQGNEKKNDNIEVSDEEDYQQYGIQLKIKHRTYPFIYEDKSEDLELIRQIFSTKK